VPHPRLVVTPNLIVRPRVVVTPSLVIGAIVAAFVLAPLTAGHAQQAPATGSDYFIPPQAHPAAPARPAARPAAGAPSPGGAPAAAPGAEGVPTEAETPGVSPQQIQTALPPPPEVPQIPRGASPPAAIVGIISVPDVMRSSTAYQAVDKELGVRRQKLNEDAQKEQTTLRDLGQALANDRGKLTADQIRAKERELQDRIADSRRKFTERNRIIQEAGQYTLAQIERTLRDVVQQVALSRGMNIILHGPQTALYLPEFDITPQVVDELNKVLPTVTVPPDGVSVLDLKPQPQAAAPAAHPVAKAAPGPAKKP
jgi:Skp family chaperone for outer membrane proteins